jgi:hypothetical protein
MGLADFDPVGTFFCEQKKVRKKTLFPAARNWLKIIVIR